MDESHSFLTESLMQGRDWKGFELAVLRLLEHCGWRHLQYIGESGDQGADIIAVRHEGGGSVPYLFQVKAVSGVNYVPPSAIDECLHAQGVYGGRVLVVVTNGEFTKSAYSRRDELRRLGYDVRLWNGIFIRSLLGKFPERSQAYRNSRDYQTDIVDRVMAKYHAGHHRAMFVVATGLGKTFIAATIAQRLYDEGVKRILVLCHAVDLAIQLQQAFWRQIDKSVPTRLFMDGKPPSCTDGISFGLYQTLEGYLSGLDPNAFDLVIVDEAHHALSYSFLNCLTHLRPRFLVGMTATPWRGDGASIETLFGKPVKTLSLVDGMHMGHLAKVDYRLMCDNLNWDELPHLSKHRLTIRDLNKRLFLPQRDEAVVSELLTLVSKTPNPKIAVFSPSVEHAERFAEFLTNAGISAACVSCEDKLLRRRRLLEFSSGGLVAISAVDLLNEGIDVPEINILVFLRATHSRRIFIQQLGRGLRISDNKKSVVVLDFVTDVRRMALVKELDDEARAGSKAGIKEVVVLKNGVVTFSDVKAKAFVDEWLNDVMTIDADDDNAELTFPDVGLKGFS